MSERWPKAGIALHWVGAVLIGLLVAAGLVMTDLQADSSARLLLSRAHAAGGAALVLLTVVRLGARRRGAAVRPLPLSALHRRGVRLVHGLLYAAVFAIGLSGLATGAQSAWPQYLSGSLTVAPALDALASRTVHHALVFVLLGLTALHVGGVLLQQLRRGGVVRRMLPFH